MRTHEEGMVDIQERVLRGKEGLSLAESPRDEQVRAPFKLAVGAPTFTRLKRGYVVSLGLSREALHALYVTCGRLLGESKADCLSCRKALERPDRYFCSQHDPELGEGRRGAFRDRLLAVFEEAEEQPPGVIRPDELAAMTGAMKDVLMGYGLRWDGDGYVWEEKP